MKQGRELDAWIAERVLGHSIVGQRKGAIKERTKAGQVRPLRAYSTDISAAWEIVRKMGITLIPIENEQWFGLVGPARGWSSPGELLKYLQTADFVAAGAAVGRDRAPDHLPCRSPRGRKAGRRFGRGRRQHGRRSRQLG